MLLLELELLEELVVVAGADVGVVAMVSILAIMTILLAVLGLVVVKAMAESPWSLFTIAMTIPLALIMGIAHTKMGVSVRNVTIFGIIGLLVSVWAGSKLGEWGVQHYFDHGGEWQAWAIMIYGFAASVLPVWMLLAPRDYLSTFMKIGTVAVLAVAVIWVAPELHMPKITKFIDGTGLVFAGTLFPFVFITIACGAISGFHALISSGTTPKLLDNESNIRSVAYGAMVTEMVVGIMALALMLVACGGGSSGPPDGDRASPVRVEGPRQVGLGATIVWRVDMPDQPADDPPSGYAITLPEAAARINIATRPCDAPATTGCQVWTLTAAADAVPGQHRFSIEPQGTRARVSSLDRGAFLEVVDAALGAGGAGRLGHGVAHRGDAALGTAEHRHRAAAHLY